MGVTKTHNFNKEQNLLANYAKAIGHPARVAILQYLLKTNQCVCGELVNVLPLAQPTISQHLKELKNTGLIKGSVEGTSVCYCIDHTNWNKAKQMFQMLFDAFNAPDYC